MQFVGCWCLLAVQQPPVVLVNSDLIDSSVDIRACVYGSDSYVSRIGPRSRCPSTSDSCASPPWCPSTSSPCQRFVSRFCTCFWTAQQMREAFPWESAPQYLLRGRDRIFGKDFVYQVNAMGTKQVLSAPRSPWQRANVERVIGTIRRGCLDHIIVFNERCLSGNSKCSLIGTIAAGHIWHWRRTARSRAVCSQSMLAGSSQSRKSVDCIIATSAALPKRPLLFGSPDVVCRFQRRSARSRSSVEPHLKIRTEVGPAADRFPIGFRRHYQR